MIYKQQYFWDLCAKWKIERRKHQHVWYEYDYTNTLPSLSHWFEAKNTHINLKKKIHANFKLNKIDNNIDKMSKNVKKMDFRNSIQKWNTV